MNGPDRDPGLDTLLDLDGQVLVVDPKGEYWVKFVVHRVDPSPARPHGLNYSLSDLLEKASARTITNTGTKRCGHTDSKMRPPYCKISGERWTRC